jgi:hypothetical protein
LRGAFRQNVAEGAKLFRVRKLYERAMARPAEKSHARARVRPFYPVHIHARRLDNRSATVGDIQPRDRCQRGTCIASRRLQREYPRRHVKNLRQTFERSKCGVAAAAFQVAEIGAVQARPLRNGSLGQPGRDAPLSHVFRQTRRAVASLSLRSIARIFGDFAKRVPDIIDCRDDKGRFVRKQYFPDTNTYCLNRCRLYSLSALRPMTGNSRL